MKPDFDEINEDRLTRDLALRGCGFLIQAAVLLALFAIVVAAVIKLMYF